MDVLESPVRAASLIVPCLVVLGACRFSAEQAPVGLDQAVLHSTPAMEAWRVEAGSRVVGSVVRYEEVTGPGRHVYAVRNPHDQDLGLIDALGRAWAYRPHAEPELLGTGSVAEGAMRILGEDAVELIPVSLQAGLRD